MIKGGKNNGILVQTIENELKKPLPGFIAQKKLAPELRLKSIENPSKNSRKSGVLLLLYFKNELLHIAFIRRSDNGGVHGGQIGFPGGKFDDTDTDLEFTSLRETYEEIGVEPSLIHVIGNLSTLFIPVSNYLVHPYVGFAASMPVFTLNQSEVDSIIELPVSEFFNPKNCIVDFVDVRGNRFEVPMFKIGDYKIWGATAMILSEFVEILSGVVS